VWGRGHQVHHHRESFLACTEARASRPGLTRNQQRQVASYLKRLIESQSRRRIPVVHNGDLTISNIGRDRVLSSRALSASRLSPPRFAHPRGTTRLHFRNRIEKRAFKDISLAGGSLKTRSTTDTQRPCSEKVCWVFLKSKTWPATLA
jgi:hypothetical protein